MQKKEDIEVDEYLRQAPIMPCFLISKDDGKIEINIDGFEKKKIPIETIKENYFKVLYQEVTEESQIIIDKKIRADISIYGKGLNCNSKTKNDRGDSEENKVLIGEYILYSFNIREEDLSFSKYFKDKFQRIANGDSSDEEKVEELEEIFASTGYFIPKKIYIGGMLIKNQDKNKKDITSETNKLLGLDIAIDKSIKIDANAGFSRDKKSELNQIFNIDKTEIRGGNHTAKSFEEWIKSINLSNSQIVECTNIIKAKTILEYNLRKKLEIPLKIIEDKYLRKKKYLEYIDEVQNEKFTTLEGKADISKGICKEIDKNTEPKIYFEHFYVKQESSIISKKKKLCESFYDVIIGFKIINCSENLKSKWFIEHNPLGKKEIAITFESKPFGDLLFSVNVYLMEYPKEIPKQKKKKNKKPPPSSLNSFKVDEESALKKNNMLNDNLKEDILPAFQKINKSGVGEKVSIPGNNMMEMILAKRNQFKKVGELPIGEAKINENKTSIKTICGGGELGIEIEKKDDKKSKVSIENFSQEKTKPFFANPNRKKEIEIVLSKIKITSIDISDALLLYNEEILTENNCNLLIPIFPEAAEYNEISQKTERYEKEEDFSDCDLFIVLIGCIPYNKERLQAILFKNSYSKKSVEILALIDYFFKGFDFIENNKNFHKFLEKILDKNEAIDFQLSSLHKLYNMKSNDNKSTLLQYKVEKIMEENDKIILSLKPYLELFSRMEITKVQKSYNSLKEKFKSVEILKSFLEKQKGDMDEDDKTEEFLSGFYEHANKVIKLLEEKIDGMNKKYNDIAKFLGLKNIEIEEFILIMKEFYLKIFEAEKLYNEKKAKKGKLK